jgi:uncharacterized protein (DUF488 family)
MTGSPTSDLLTIGHSNLPAEQFLSLLKEHSVTTVIDVRSVPFSRRFPWFSSRTLSERLHSKGIAYMSMGETLGGRPDDPALYRDDIADYQAMAATAEFQAGIDRVVAAAKRQRVCLMCAEREPLDCHRCLLVARALARRGYTIGHILGDGTVEPHSTTEERLLAGFRSSSDDLFDDRAARLDEAYRLRAAKIAARLSDRVRPGRTPRTRGPRAYSPS